MLFLDAHTGIVLHRKYIKNETNALYSEGLDFLRTHGVHIEAVVCDGHTGLLKSISSRLVQMCQFHMYQIIKRKLTAHPRLECGKELLDLCHKMFHLHKEDFTREFAEWCERWNKFLAERTTLTTGGTTYTHRGLRSARKSVNYHLQWLFTFEDYKRLRIPKTTNRLEGVNSRLKRAVKEHNGMNEANKRKVIDAFLNSTKSRN